MISVEVRDRDSDSPFSTAPSWVFSCEESDGVPRLFGDHHVHATQNAAIGHGGDRGSLVYSMKTRDGLLPCFGFSTALKVYPVSVTSNELEFIRVLFSNDLNSSGDGGVCRRVPYLLLPLAVANIEGVDRGILMEQQNCSLKQFLLSKRSECQSASFFDRESDSDDEAPETDANSSLLYERVFEPLRSCEVVTAIAFQLVVALSALNEELPHVTNGVPCSGFTHNDVHLDNILLHFRDGHISLCDFELVGHIAQPHVPHDLPRPLLNRLPPYSRQSPHGLFCRTADTWALGLVVISLLTGVDPLLDDDKLLDDFGDGPLLQSHAVSDGAAPVVDWAENLAAHVVHLLMRDDPSGGRRREAEPLLNLCAKCLVNRTGAQPSTAVELLKEPIFAAYMDAPYKAENVIRAWIDASRA